MSSLTSRTATVAQEGGLHLKGSADAKSPSLPTRLPDAYATLPKLTREQAGHLRHFHNLASQLDGEWNYMGSQEPGQEWLDGYRYQLATMAYATGAAHFHRLPALRTVLQPLMLKLIKKMLRREIWSYWYLTSQSGKLVDPDITELRKPWADPVCKENIMYSGHLLLMISLYSMLFDDDTFDQPDSIVFDWNPIFWGMGAERFSYTRTTLQEAIVAEMERNKWMGVCCEPNLVFVVCNQFPLLAMHYNDVRNNTHIASDVLTKYKAAWAGKGGMAANGGAGPFRDMYVVKQDVLRDAQDIGWTAWAATFMGWNAEAMEKSYPSLSIGYITHLADGRVNVNHPQVAAAIRDIVAQDPESDPNSEEVIEKAREMVREAGMKPMGPFPFTKPTFGYVTQWASESAPTDEDLEGLLSHADKYLNPKWEKGGLYYPRNDSGKDGWDDEGNYMHMDPYTGNAAIGYARLNTRHGQRIMYEKPWTPSQLESRPYIHLETGLESGVDFLQGSWDEERGAMVMGFRTWDGRQVMMEPKVRNLKDGMYGIYVDGELRTQMSVEEGELAVGEVKVEGDDVQVVVLRA